MRNIEDVKGRLVRGDCQQLAARRDCYCIDSRVVDAPSQLGDSGAVTRSKYSYQSTLIKSDKG